MTLHFELRCVRRREGENVQAQKRLCNFRQTSRPGAESSRHSIFPFRSRYPGSDFVRDSCINGDAITHPEFPCSREELTVLVKADRHDPVRGVERFFHAVAVVNIDIDIQHAIVISNAAFRPCSCHDAGNHYLSSSRIPSTMSLEPKIRQLSMRWALVSYHSRNRTHWLHSSSHGVNHQPNLWLYRTYRDSAEQHPLEERRSAITWNPRALGQHTHGTTGGY